MLIESYLEVVLREHSGGEEINWKGEGLGWSVRMGQELDKWEASCVRVQTVCFTRLAESAESAS